VGKTSSTTTFILVPQLDFRLSKTCETSKQPSTTSFYDLFFPGQPLPLLASTSLLAPLLVQSIPLARIFVNKLALTLPFLSFLALRAILPVITP
jgi:hypothetical protein